MREVLSNRAIGYWFIYQLFKSHANPSTYLNFRVIINKKPEPGTDGKETGARSSFSWPIKGFKEAWSKEGGYFDQLKAMNEDPTGPGNIYYGLSLRKSAHAKQTKENCLGFSCLYLDLDVTARWSLQDRHLQLAYWKSIGLYPSIVISSGHGIQVIWCLRTTYENIHEVEAILRRMVEVCDCKEGGNCSDVSRIFRMPGFKNQKRWYENDSPECCVIYPSPDVISKQLETNEQVQQYDLEPFKTFPLSGIDDIADIRRAANIPGNAYEESLELLSKSVADHQNNRTIHKTADLVVQQQQKTVLSLTSTKKSGFEPLFNNIPADLDSIPIPKDAKKWFLKYCRKGLSELTPKEYEAIAQKFGVDTLNASEMDAKVVYTLIKCRYSWEAIQEFWRRPELKLYRAAKMNNSPNYLKMTYDSMYHAFSNAMLQDATLKSLHGEKNSIFIDENGKTRIVRPNGIQDVILTGHLEIKERYHDLDETIDGHQEYFLLDIVDQSQRKFPQIMRRSAFGSLREFRNVCKYDLFCLSNRDSDLSMLLSYLLEKAKDVPIGTFNSAIKYDDVLHGFVFPNYTVYENRIEACSNPALQSLLLKYHPLCKIWLRVPPTKREAATEFFRLHEHLYKMHAPKLVLACIGSLCSFAMRKIFQTKMDIDIPMPTLNIRGTSCSGKTETLQQFYRLTGCTKPQECRMGTSSTMFGLSKIIESFQSLPTLVDEFKEEDDGVGKNKHMQNVRELVRRLYSGELVARGKADLSVNRSSLQSSLWVSGESILERLGHIAEMSRIFPIQTDSWDTGLSMDHWQTVRTGKLEYVSPFMYQFLLTLNPEQELSRLTATEKRYRAAMSEHFGRLANRIAMNVATLAYGVDLWDRFAAWLVPDRPILRLQDLFNLDDEFCTYIINHASRTGNIISLDYKGKRIIREKDEAVTFLNVLGTMTVSKHPRVTELKERGTPCTIISDDQRYLYVFPDLAYDAYRSYCLDMKYAPFERATILGRIDGAYKREEPWILDPDLPYVAEGKPPVTSIKLDIQALREMRIWPRDASDASPLTDEVIDDVIADF